MMQPPFSYSDRDSTETVDTGRIVQKLTKINAALMHRVERSMDQQANAFTLFQTAINLESQIRLRTEELNSALSKLERANAALSEARDAAERANRFKTRFFTALGHDLLQPLHAARLSLAELMEAPQPPAQHYLGQSIGRALSTIEDLLTAILDISKLDAGVYVPNMQAIALNDVFEHLALGLEPMTRKKGLDLRWRPTALAVRSDPLMLRRMLQNLLANAAHYTTSGGLLLAARRRGAKVSIEVWDTGPGIASSEQDRIFEEFQRGMASEHTGGAGFGLGLTIVRRMSEALEHSLQLQSRLGHGSRFAILAPAVEAPQENPARLQPIYPDAATSLAQPLIVIDNDLAVLEAMQSLLARWGADVRLARDFDDIADILADGTFRPAMILADYHLDDGALGVEAVARIRDKLGSDTPAILITADRTETTTAAAATAACELLHKPVRPAELRALMLHLLR